MQIGKILVIMISINRTLFKKELKMKDKIKSKIGIAAYCVHCQSENIEYLKPVFVDDIVTFPYSCSDCGGKGQEVYELTLLRNEPHQ